MTAQTRTSRETTGPSTEYPLYVEVRGYDERENPTIKDNCRVELIIEGATLGLGYGISKERANELAERISIRLGIEAKLKE